MLNRYSCWQGRTASMLVSVILATYAIAGYDGARRTVSLQREQKARVTAAELAYAAIAE